MIGLWGFADRGVSSRTLGSSQRFFRGLKLIACSQLLQDELNSSIVSFVCVDQQLANPCSGRVIQSQIGNPARIRFPRLQAMGRYVECRMLKTLVFTFLEVI